MKAFELKTDGETEIIAANTNIEALQFYFELTGIDFIDLKPEDTINEIPKRKWKGIKIRNDKYDEFNVDNTESKELFTLLELMEGKTTPDLISSTAV